MADTNVVPRRGTRVPRRALAALAVVLLAATAACSGNSSESASRPLSKGAPEQADRRDTSAQDNGQKAKQPPVAAQDRAMVHTADLTVRVKNVAGASSRAKGVTTDAGGYVATENTTHTDADGSHDDSLLVLRVPVDAYPSTLDRLRRDIGRLLTLRQSSEDKTSEVADVKSRITSAQSSLRRLRKIMDQATTVSDIMDVESAISTREADLESLQARAKALDRQTSYSTIDLHLIGPKTVAHKKAAEPGFWDGLTGGWHALLEFLRVAVLVIGAVLPFAALAALIAAPVWWFWRRRRRRAPEEATAAATE